MKRFAEYLSQHKYLYLLLLLIPILIWFRYLEHIVQPQYIMHTALDDEIPFVKGFAVFYVLWFLYIPFGVIFTAAYSKKDFLKLLLFLFGGMAVSNAVYALFPNMQDLRPVITGSDPLSLLVRLIYSSDTPTNVCPSMHVINTIAVDAALRHSEQFSKKRYRCVLSAVFAVLVCLSTMLIKQHSVLDVAGGLLVSACFYVPLYLLEPLKANGAGRLRIPGRGNKA
jgi:membrane-associated phospholipid phosphatase